MERNVSLNEISDGKLYGLNDMVKAGCNNCKGCAACCRGMGNTILLDPLDICRLTGNLNQSFEELLAGKLELNIVDGVILPNLKMVGPDEHCPFLSDAGRCEIHSFRPGICRLFPLGRYYENHGYQYILQIHECPYPNKTKVKVRKWIDIPDIKDNEQFVIDWHYFLKDVQGVLRRAGDDNLVKTITMYLLKSFYLKPYDNNADFYPQFYQRLKDAKYYISTLS